MKIAPSLLAADFLHLEKDVQMLNANADIIHLDIMDGSLVSNISFGFSVAEPVCRMATVPTDAHLMIIHPERYFERFAQCGTKMLSFHYEAARLAHKCPRTLLRKIRKLGMKAGIAINPDIPVQKIFKYLKYADFVVLMSVFAGFGGQKFIYETYDRLGDLKAEIQRRGLKCEIEVDGGVGPDNAAGLSKFGADILVAGSSVFRSEDPAATIRQLREA